MTYMDPKIEFPILPKHLADLFPISRPHPVKYDLRSRLPVWWGLPVLGYFTHEDRAQLSSYGAFTSVNKGEYVLATYRLNRTDAELFYGNCTDKPDGDKYAMQFGKVIFGRDNILKS